MNSSSQSMPQPQSPQPQVSQAQPKLQHPRSLSATLAIAFFTLSVVVLLVSGALLLFSSLRTQQESIGTNLHLVASDAAQVVSGFFQEGQIDSGFRRLVADARLHRRRRRGKLRKNMLFESGRIARIFGKDKLLNARRAGGSWFDYS